MTIWHYRNLIIIIIIMFQFNVAVSLAQGSGCTYRGRTLLAHRNNYGPMPFCCQQWESNSGSLRASPSP